ncbi:hypothetical protein D3C87_1621330 [compost metagenome]
MVHFQSVELNRAHFTTGVNVELAWGYRMIEGILVDAIHSIIGQAGMELEHQLRLRRSLWFWVMCFGVGLGNGLALAHGDQLAHGHTEVTDRGQHCIFQPGHAAFEGSHATLEVIQAIARVGWAYWLWSLGHGQFPLLALKIATTFALMVWISLPTL